MAGEGNSASDIKAHERDYSNFMAMLKWSTILSFLTGAVVVLIIAS